MGIRLVCIPAFNAENTIGDIVKECLLYVDKVIVCDDGSTDDTAIRAKKNGAEIIRHEKNYGYGAALITLFDKAREYDLDVMITLDADGQHIPEFIPRLIAPLSYPNVDVVIGSRFLSNQTGTPAHRKTGIKIITAANNLGGQKITDSQSGFRAYSKKAVQQIHPTEYGMAASTEILAKIQNKGLKVAEVPIVISYDDTRPKQNPVSHGIGVFMNVVKYLSIKHPIISYGFPGITLIIVGTILGIQFFDVYLNEGIVFIGTLLASIITFIAGIILATTAILLFSMATLLRDNK